MQSKNCGYFQRNFHQKEEIDTNMRISITGENRPVKYPTVLARLTLAHGRPVYVASDGLMRKLLVSAWRAPNSFFKYKYVLLCPNRGTCVYAHIHNYKREMDHSNGKLKNEQITFRCRKREKF